VAKKEYYSSDRVPMPIEKVKSIVGKFIRPKENDKGEMMIYCPMCECEISADTCYDILYDPLVKEVPGIITEEKMKERYEFCSFCKYNDE